MSVVLNALIGKGVIRDTVQSQARAKEHGEKKRDPMFDHFFGIIRVLPKSFLVIEL